MVTPADPVVVAFQGELTIKEAPALRESLLAAIRSGARMVILDMTAVSFMDQAAVGVVVGARERLTRDGGELRLAGLQKKVERVLGLLDSNLPIYPTVAAALEAPPGG